MMYARSPRCALAVSRRIRENTAPAEREPREWRDTVVSAASSFTELLASPLRVNYTEGFNLPGIAR
ncbi:hypothetical protein NSPZN2_40178 [Nitrospira defluvii]|uniref:Uncharacterized protein n=1 Tax=Nitrospira defluvii TaxID=330214 RepID=A0ABN7LYR6_9BACT|nr:hypothetical protein NSPZN2_40178 [Nitrospira defluvii]